MHERQNDHTSDMSYDYPSDLDISVGEAVVAIPLVGFAVGAYVAIEAGRKAKQKVEQVLVDFGKSKRSGDVLAAGLVTILTPFATGSKIGEAVANLGEKMGIVPPVKDPRKAVWRIPLREIFSSNSSRVQ